ncbi:MAG: septum formation family protein [Acidimicrobiia bacterium]|nr:septum formation family protein [Acidimicrobiia bacterium]
MQRLWTLAAVLMLAASACTGPTTSPPSTAQTPDVTSTTTTTTAPGPESPDPSLPDPVDVAEQGWGTTAGFTRSDLDESDLASVDSRLRSVMGSVIEGLSYAGLEPDEGGDLVIGLSMSPAVFLQGDPFLAPGLAGSLAGPFADVEDITVEGTAAYRVFLADSWWYFWASNTHLYAMIGAEPETERALAATIAGADEPYRWQTGDCLWFGTGEDTVMPFAPYGRNHVIPCTGPHTHEVIYASTTDYGPEDDYPGEAFSTEVERSCGLAFRNYVGVDWSDSKATAVRYLPDLTEWDEGDRYIACVAELTDPTGGATRLTGTLEGLGEASLIERSAGDCHIASLNADPVDCRLTHTAQFIGYLEDATPPDTPYPGISNLFESEQPACDGLLEEFSTRLEKDGARISAHIVPPSVVEWEDDLRRYRCYAFAVDAEGRRLEISGSFDGEWTIVRFSEDDLTAEVLSSRFCFCDNV